MRFNVGDLVILSDVEQPYGRLVAVITATRGSLHKWSYLSDEPALKPYGGQWSRMDSATLVADFGVSIRAADGQYWCEQVSASKATYPDGKPRQWQEPHPIKYTPRAFLSELLWPF